MKSYDISFPQHPSDEVLDRVKAAGMHYERPRDPFGMGHCGSGGIWRGVLSVQQLVDLQLPTGTKVK